MDAIESGIVKIPRVPVSDDSMTGDLPDVPRPVAPRPRRAPAQGHQGHDRSRRRPDPPQGARGRAARASTPTTSASYRDWADAGMGTPPVFIVVCSNTARSKLVYDWIAGWEKDVRRTATKTVVPGQPAAVQQRRGRRLCATGRTRSSSTRRSSTAATRSTRRSRRPPRARSTSSSASTSLRFPGRSADDITDEDILREVMNTVGKPGRLGRATSAASCRSSMLTEGWDANTVTHILGIRAFGTQLLCEQVVGPRAPPGELRRRRRRPVRARVRRGLRRPVQFLSVTGTGAGSRRQAGPGGPGAPRARRPPDRVPAPHRLPLRDADRAPRRDLRRVERSSQLSTQEVPTQTELDPIVGEIEPCSIYRSTSSGCKRSIFAVAKRTLDNHFRDDEGGERPWLFPQLVRITQALDRRVRHAVPEGRRLPADAPARRVQPRRRGADQPGDRAGHRAARSG